MCTCEADVTLCEADYARVRVCQDFFVRVRVSVCVCARGCLKKERRVVHVYVGAKIEGERECE